MELEIQLISIIQGLKNGDEKSFEQFYDLFAQRLGQHIMCLVKDQALAEDILQEVMMLIIKHIPSFTPLDGKSRGLKTWCFRIATNRAIDALRARKDKLELVIDDSLNLPTAQDVEDDLIAQEQSKILGQAITQLPFPYRAMLSMRLAEGLDYFEIGQVLGMSVSAIKQSMLRARHMLREKLVQERAL